MASIRQRAIFYELESTGGLALLDIKTPDEIDESKIDPTTVGEAKRWEELIDAGFEFLLSNTQNVNDLRAITTNQASEEQINRILDQFPDDRLIENVQKLTKTVSQDARPRFEQITQELQLNKQADLANQQFIANLQAFQQKQLEFQKQAQEANLKAQQEANKFFQTGQINFQPFRFSSPAPALTSGSGLPIGQVGEFNFLA